jgi:hypothetical protein
VSEGMFLNLTDSRDGLEGAILQDVSKERDRQQQKWGPQTHSIAEWLMILGEEYGEACQAGNECYFRDESLARLRKELIQTMAVALAIIEGLDHLPKPDEKRLQLDKFM